MWLKYQGGAIQTVLGTQLCVRLWGAHTHLISLQTHCRQDTIIFNKFSLISFSLLFESLLSGRSCTFINSATFNIIRPF